MTVCMLPTLEQYQLDPVHGFISKTHFIDSVLPPELIAYEQVLSELVPLLQANRLRARVAELPEFNLSLLQTQKEWERAYFVISYLSQGYVWSDCKDVTGTLPKKLAVPWCEISDRLGLLPVISYVAVEFFNLRLHDIHGPLDLSNMTVEHTFTGLQDEAWFFLISLGIEAVGGRALVAILETYQGVQDDDLDKIKHGLTVIADALYDMTGVLERMYEKNQPEHFYHKVRPYMTGWENSKYHPNGLFYQGTSPPVALDDSYSSSPKTTGGSYRKYAGGSAGQSPLIQCLDIALGIEHFPTGVKKSDGKSSKPSYIYHMRSYMLPNHRGFIEALSSLPCIRPFLQHHSDETLVDVFNKAVSNMKTFREKHFQMVTRYIILPATRQRELDAKAEAEALAQDPSSPTKEKEQVPPARGTGGTDLVPFLKQMKQETIDAKIN